MKTKAIAVLLAVILLAMACNVSQVEAYINLAVGIALQVAKLAGLSPTVANQVSADLAMANKLVADYQAADAKAKPGILQEVDTYLQVAESDLSAILTAVHVGDSGLRATIQASIAIAITAVDSIYQLENAKQPTAAAKVVRVMVPGIPRGKRLAPDQLKTLYNQTVAAYPQAQLH